MNTGKVRIYDLSKELNLDNRDILALCKQLNISVKSHSSTITEAEASRIRAAAEKAEKIVSSPALRSVPSVSKRVNPQLVKKKKQILEIRKTRPLAEPSDQVAEPPPQQLIIRRTPRTAQGYIEPLEVGNALPLQMVLVPSGTFLMGSPEDEIDRSDDEGPQHSVTLPPFFMGRYPVTQAQWRAVAALPQIDRPLESQPSHFQGENHPVERVSWHEAVEFCARLAQLTSRPYRLPSEAEWEYACRAGTTTPFYFGKTLTDELANYRASSTYADGPKGEFRQTTTPVNYFGLANAFGLSDMHGNVWEWCQDHWHDNYTDAPTNAWLNRNDSASRVRRGGSWNDHPRSCRSAFRDNDLLDDRSNDIGFRVVCFASRTS